MEHIGDTLGRCRRASTGPEGPSALHYAFTPYPKELADMERKRKLSPNQIKLLALRRFADPLTGVWETSTAEIARLIGVGRSTAQKLLRRTERDRYLHVRHRRTRTVELTTHHGGFSLPKHKKLGLPPLRWDADFTERDTEPTPRTTDRPPVENSAEQANSRVAKRKKRGDDSRQGTVRRTCSTYNVPVRRYVNKNVHDVRYVPTKNDRRPVAKNVAASETLTPVTDFQPRNHEENVVRDLAEQLGERTINGFLSLLRDYGFTRLQSACARAKEKLLDHDHPLRRPPGAYVRWLLQTGKC